MLSIDQMRYDYLTRFASLYKGGLKMLLDGGAVFSEAKYRHASTETGPGHSVILSGRHPSHSGIVANDWYDSYLKKFINVVDDLYSIRRLAAMAEKALLPPTPRASPLAMR